MTFHELLSTLTGRGVQLRRDGSELVVRGDEAVLDSVLVDAMRRHKNELLNLVENNDGDWWSSVREITPDMLPLVTLTGEQINRIVAAVHGGAGNVQDIYPLAPLQEGILSHHLLAAQGDQYLGTMLLSFDSRNRLDALIDALQKVIDRHDILRTAVLWEDLPEPVQVVWRRARLTVEELHLDADAGSIGEQLAQRFDPRHYRIDVRVAPLMRMFVAEDKPRGRWILLWLLHHMAGDQTTGEVIYREVRAHMLGLQKELPKPLPFRNFVAHTRRGVTREEHQVFFGDLLGDVEEPTMPFGLSDMRSDNWEVADAALDVDMSLSTRLRARARLLGVSPASVFHVAFALVLARVSGRDDVVFGTVLSGRAQGGEGADWVPGLFINTLPVRVKTAGRRVEQCVREVHALLALLVRHEHASLTLAQRCSAVEPPTPLFTSVLNYRHSRVTAPIDDGSALQGIELVGGTGGTNYPFAFSVDDSGDGFRLRAYVQRSFDPEQICGYMRTALEGLVEALERAPSAAVASVEVLPEEERARLLVEWNATAAEYPRERCVHELIEEQARKRPDAIAVVYEEGKLSYGELNSRANRLARYLREQGVGADRRVGICMERSLEMVVSLLGVLKAGGAYVPLDPGYPWERLEYMLKDSEPSVVLTHGAVSREVRGRLEEARGRLTRVVDVEEGEREWEKQGEENLETGEIGLSAQNLAYVIYTSGSTGNPKGVMVAHRNVVSSTNARTTMYSHWDRFLLVTSLSFDGSVAGLFGTLTAGGTLVLPGKRGVAGEMGALIRDSRITRLDCVPSFFREVVEAVGRDIVGLREVTVAGERCPTALLRQASQAAPKIHLYNEYGPTEATVWSTAYRCEMHVDGIVPIGRPIANTRIYLLDEEGRPVPVGVAGELCIGGAGVARGYLNRAELTAERFVADPYAEEAGARMYRTGDLARYRPDGNIEFLGRTDFQVKVRGYRIELGEIEAQLNGYPGVREAVVVAREESEGDKRLVAYYREEGEEGLTAEELRGHLLEVLPEYMVPAAYVKVAEWPLTVNGKLDRKGLPGPEEGAYATREYEAPRGETERELARIWSEVLGVERIGRHDNFFELGGHSLRAGMVVERMRAVGLHVEGRALFTAPTLAKLATLVRGTADTRMAVPENRIPEGCEAITPQMLPLVQLTEQEIERIVAGVPGGAANVRDIYPLAPLQEGILFHHLLSDAGDPYLGAVSLSFDSRERLDRFIEALQGVVDRHDILRTAVQWEGLREPVQVVWRKAPLAVEEVRIEAREGDVSERLRERFDPRRYRLDVRTAPLMKMFIAADRANDRWILLWLRHHLAGDHTTLEVLRREVHAHLLGRQSQLPKPPPFRDFVAQARLGISNEEHEEFFKKLLGDVTEPTAPFGLVNVRGDGSDVKQATVQVDASLSRRLRNCAQTLGVSAASIFHLAFARMLATVSARDDVVFGTVLFGRMQGGEGGEWVPGPFINTLPVRVWIDATGVQSGVRRMHELLAQLLRHEHASLALMQRCSAVVAPAPLFSALLNFRHNDEHEPSPEEAQTREGIGYVWSQERTNYPFTFSVDDLGDDFFFKAQVQRPAEPERICEYMQRAVELLVEALEHRPLAALDGIEVLPERERERALAQWNATAREYPRGRCVHELFEAQVRERPGAVAVLHQTQELTYRELNERANRLAWRLREDGLTPGEAVVLEMPRGVEMLVSELAVLKCGATYVPVDPQLPVERRQLIVDDCGAKRVLRVGGTEAGEEYSSADLGLAPHASGAAYVMYTSGSTGVPKGVVVPHGAVAARVCEAGYCRIGAEDCVAHTSNPSFDASTFEVWSALLNGARLLIVSAEVMLEPAGLARVLKEGGVTVLHLTTGLFNQYADSLAEVYAGVKCLMFGGEASDPNVVRRVLERSKPRELLSFYGPTETTTFASCVRIEAVEDGAHSIPIGRPIANTTIYILDSGGRIVPSGVAGEIHIGGAGVALGYLNGAAGTAERFVPDPYAAEAGVRMYRTGDLGRYRSNGNIEFLGRNDAQIKIRGFRIEPGEIAAQLVRHEGVKDAVVVAIPGVRGERRLVAYFTRASGTDEGAAHDIVETLGARLRETLPEYMLPAAYVELPSLPLTPRGKLDHQALPLPGDDAYATNVYEPPANKTEAAVADIWSAVLGVERVGRRDNFFELGGHSLLAVRVIERMRDEGLHVDVRSLFATPTLAALAEAVRDCSGMSVEVPENRIPPDALAITPDMLSLVQLTATEIDGIVSTVEGGARNLQDVYPLAALQEGILFHHLLGREGDAYLSPALLSFASRERLDAFAQALQSVIDRHDILRTAVLWQGLAEPLQVVWRRARLVVEDIELDPDEGDLAEQLSSRFDPRHYRIDLTQAPLMRMIVTRDVANDRYLVLWLLHHLAGDHATLEVVRREVRAHLLGRQAQLPAPLPFRNFVAQARLGIGREEHEEFFRRMVGDVDEPTTPFGLTDVHGDGSKIAVSWQELDPTLVDRLRVRAGSLGVTVASLYHVAFAQVLARLSMRKDDVVFGTVLFGRMHSSNGADWAPGLFINTLPLRIRLGEKGVEDAVRGAHDLLARLLRHEHASLALVQRCSAVAPPTALFSAVLNYLSPHHIDADASQAEDAEAWAGIRVLGGDARSNYPFVVEVNHARRAVTLKVQIQAPFDPEQICGYMRTALEGLVEALERAPSAAVASVEVLPEEERARLLVEWNATAAEYPRERCVHELIEEQARKRPDAIAVVYEEGKLSYGELNSRANRLARYLREQGVGADRRVGICMERSLEMVVSLLGVLKAGGAYVPLDPGYPWERLEYMLKDSEPSVVLTHGAVSREVRGRLEEARGRLTRVVDVEEGEREWEKQGEENLETGEIGLSAQNLAYVIYTSGSTGRPKAVAIEHRGVTNYLHWASTIYSPTVGSLVSSPLSFDATITSLWVPLTCGGEVRLLPEAREQELLEEHFRGTSAGALLKITPTHLEMIGRRRGASPTKTKESVIVIGGEALSPSTVALWRTLEPDLRLINEYGPTETVVGCVTYEIPREVLAPLPIPIGRPIANTRIYLLDEEGRPVPVGVAGELCIGGAGVARGYLNRAELTAERFVADPYAEEAGARMYRTGDLARYRPDGNIEFLGRTDFQVKVRGYRIELGEIEAQLNGYPGVREAVVVAREESEGDKRLVAYYREEGEEGLTAEELRGHLLEVLPEYMVPAAYVKVAEWPLTVNGKLDRKGLPGPEEGAYATREYEAPRGETERELARIWSEVLGVERIGRHDNFFELGGHSLLAVSVIERMRRKGFNADVRALFTAPSVRELAEGLEDVEVAL